jgi:sorbitol-6-phosphate 2-dehydrogenase
MTSNVVETPVWRVAPWLRGLLAFDGHLPGIRFTENAAPRAVALPALGESEPESLSAIRAIVREHPGARSFAVPTGESFEVLPALKTRGRLTGRLAVVTGAAQGFGFEISEALLAQGARVALLDIGADRVQASAEQLASRFGAEAVLGITGDVTNSSSMAEAMDVVLKAWGGIDLFVSNAGVLRAGSVKTQTLADFELVTKVNYTGFFVCTQLAAPLMARQHAANPSWMGDIIQINSKSGLAGSNRNGAYAGSKFGGIGLVQSFAMELVEDGIKVNAICPGNFFEGPLWSDPTNGLFVQYLRSGKVPGAKTIEDVRRSYKEKVPMRRGCRTADVMKALLYLVEQEYETGQAVPVTGGQIMLH